MTAVTVTGVDDNGDDATVVIIEPDEDGGSG